MLRLAILTTLLGAVGAGPVTAEHAAEPPEPQEQSEHMEESPEANEQASLWEFQVFGRGGAAGLVARGEASLALASTVSPTDETVGYSREASWGAGLRLLRGRWGLEIQHHRVAGRVFTPSAMVRETRWRGVQDLTITDSADDLLSALATWEVPLHDKRASFYLAVGGGYLLVEGDSGRLRLNDLPPGISRTGSFDGASHEATIEMTGGDFRADRGIVVFGGSLGVTLKMGRMFLRPRLDVFFGGARSTEERWDMQLDFSEIQHQTEATMTLHTAMRPRFFLFSVDVGWSSRP